MAQFSIRGHSAGGFVMLGTSQAPQDVNFLSFPRAAQKWSPNGLLERNPRPVEPERITTAEPLLNDTQAAQFLGGLHPKTVQRMARRGDLPSTESENTGAIVLVNSQNGLCYILRARSTRLLIPERRFNEQTVSARLPVSRIAQRWP